MIFATISTQEKQLRFEDIEEELKNRERENDRRDYLQLLGINVKEIGDCHWKKWRTENKKGD